jgi:hypothetical protein
METTDKPSMTTTKLNRIAWLSQQDPKKEFAFIMHHFNEGSLRECFAQLDGSKAVGTDKITKEDYAMNLENNLKELIEREENGLSTWAGKRSSHTERGKARSYKTAWY